MARPIVDSARSTEGSCAAVLREMREPPRPRSANVDEFDTAIGTGQPPIRSGDLDFTPAALARG
jgi:hypothetical protein